MLDAGKVLKMRAFGNGVLECRAEPGQAWPIISVFLEVPRGELLGWMNPTDLRHAFPSGRCARCGGEALKQCCVWSHHNPGIR